MLSFYFPLKEIQALYQAQYNLIQSQMDIELDETNSSDQPAALRTITNTEKKMPIFKVRSQSRKTARKHLRITKRKNHIRKLSLHDQEEDTHRNLHPKTHKDGFKTFVSQVTACPTASAFTSNAYASATSTYYLSEVVRSYKVAKSAAREHLISSVNILKALQNSKMPSKQQLKSKLLHLERKKGFEDKKTVVFDLDQTLIHCNETLDVQHDLRITITFPTGETADAGINIRPWAVELLKSLKGKYEVIIFTASNSCYADEILNFLDPEGDLIHHRLYREHCVQSEEGFFVKDLRILNRSLKDVILVDNAAYSYAFQLDNGIPIIPYFKGKEDFQLKALEMHLMNLISHDDLRASNRELFKLNRYLQYHGSVDRLVQELYLQVE